MSIRTVSVPQVILDTCPLPDEYEFEPETPANWARISQKDKHSPDFGCPVWITVLPNSIMVSYWREDSTPNMQETLFPLTATDEELWRFAYAQFVLGDWHD